MAYSVEFASEARRQSLKLSLPNRVAVARAIDKLAANPRRPGVRRLKGTNHLYRARAGDYRIIYGVHEERLIVHVVRVAHRSVAYRRTDDLPDG